MKTIEEKAKAYDEALERARNIRFGNPQSGTANTVCEEIFPELKEESEDERISKEIIKYLEQTVPHHHRDEVLKSKEWIAWLEKQKTKKNEWLFEKGKWYVKLQHHYEGDLRHFEKGHVYQALSEVEITDGYHNVSLGSWEIPEYFRPATKDEIPEEAKQTSRLDEDEEIRNYFINAVKEQPNIHQEWKEKCLNWLEKQGEQKPKDRYTFNSIPRLLDMVEPTDRAKAYCQKLIDSLLQEGYSTDAKIVGECLKKMNGEDVPMATMDEKQDKQEPTNKVEPKFKAGDWITNGLCSFKISSIDDKYYWSYEDTVGGDIESINNQYHLWAIEDARGGDVLVYHNTVTEIIMLFKSWVVDGTTAYTHFHIFNNNFRVNDSCDCGNGAHPATKEQRDLLFQKMKEAGYKWDAEKKELTAIKPKFDIGDTIQYNGLGHNEYVIKEVHYPTHYVNELGRRVDMPYTDANFTFVVGHADNKPEWWSEEDEEIINKISVAVATHYSCDTAVKVENWLKSLRSHLKQGWSKDDEVKLKSVCALIRNTSLKGNEGIEELTIDWIRSLKDRIQSQSKQEWKQENTGDLTDFENAMMHIGESFFGQHAGLDPNETGAVKEQANLLLGLVPKQGWSEDDEQYLLVCKNALSKYQVTDKWDSSIISQWLDNRLGSLKDRAFPQQQEWSEEEKGNVDIIVSRLEVDIEYWKSRSKRRIDEDKRVIDWLKSLKNRVLPQPKQEWSEEDQNALEDVREAIIHYWGGDTQDILLYWIKSLKQRIKKEAV